MPELKRNFFSGYYSADPANPRLFHGIEVYHAVDCGRYDDNGTERALMHYTLCKDDLPDTQGRNCEMCDFSLLDADLDNQPIMQAPMTDPASAMALVHPAVGALLMDDFAAGLGPFEIAEMRAGVLVPEFLGFTLAEVLSWRPDIYQPILDEEGNEVPNVNRCSLEQE
ncbi:MAG: hypothetical protein EOM03_18275 [Clostridia bacterium]|nr:hypothetical protein [Clostridia bacterium]